VGRSVSYANGSEVILYTHFNYDEDEFVNELNWEDSIGNLVYGVKRKFKSFDTCDEWLGREDKAILENSLAYIGVSEYCGLVSVWVKPKDDETYNLGVNFAHKIRKNLEKIVENSFGVRLVKVGHFSNGECLFEKV
jgi:hypothetical protein